MGCVFDNPKCTNGLYINDQEQKNDFSNFLSIISQSQNDKPNNNELNEVAKPNLSVIKIESINQNTLVKPKQQLSPRRSSGGFQEELMPLPKIELLVYSNHTTSLVDTIVLTPNSVKSDKHPIKIYQTPHKFSFGKDIRNDCVIDDDSLGKYQFHINVICNKFHIIDNLKGTGLFVKILNKLVIAKDAIVSFGADHMYIHSKDNEDNSKNVQINFCQNKNIQCTYNSNKKKIVTVGRNKNCDIHYQEDSVSKVQCTLIFENNNWIIYDGSYEKNEQRCSTNGLWLLASKSIKLTDKMNLKTGGLKITVVLDPLNSLNEDDNQDSKNQGSIKDE